MFGVVRELNFLRAGLHGADQSHSGDSLYFVTDDGGRWERRRLTHSPRTNWMTEKWEGREWGVRERWTERERERRRETARRLKEGEKKEREGRKEEGGGGTVGSHPFDAVTCSCLALQTHSPRLTLFF